MTISVMCSGFSPVKEQGHVHFVYFFQLKKKTVIVSESINQHVQSQSGDSIVFNPF